MAKSFSARGFESLELRTLSLEILSSKQKGISSVKSFRWRVQMKFLATFFRMDTSNEISCHYFFGWTIQMKFLAIILTAGTHL